MYIYTTKNFDFIPQAFELAKAQFESLSAEERIIKILLNLGIFKNRAGFDETMFLLSSQFDGDIDIEKYSMSQQITNGLRSIVRSVKCNQNQNPFYDSIFSDTQNLKSRYFVKAIANYMHSGYDFEMYFTVSYRETYVKIITAFNINIGFQQLDIDKRIANLIISMNVCAGTCHPSRLLILWGTLIRQLYDGSFVSLKECAKKLDINYTTMINILSSSLKNMYQKDLKSKNHVFPPSELPPLPQALVVIATYLRRNCDSHLI